MGSRKFWRVAASALLFAASLQSAPALAQQTEANLLFDEGRASMAKRDYSGAISKLEQSQQLDPAVGTLLNLAECYAALGRTASAWSAYRDATSLAATTKQLERERYAARKAQELEPQLSRLVVVVPSAARLPGLALTRNGVPLPEGLWGAAVPVDPGAQHLEAQAPGYQPWTFDVDVAGAAGNARVEVPPLAAEPAPAPPAPPPTQPPPALVPAPRPAPVATDAGVRRGADAQAATSPLPALGWVGVAGGAVAFGAGVFLFADGRTKISDANCPNQICVRGIGDKSLHDAGRAHEKLGIGVGIAGLVLTGAGVTLLLLAPPPKSAASLNLRVRLAGSGVDVSGAF